MDKDVEFWEHWCPVEQDIIGTEKGHTCNWCDATENDEQFFPFVICLNYLKILL